MTVKWKILDQVVIAQTIKREKVIIAGNYLKSEYFKHVMQHIEHVIRNFLKQSPFFKSSLLNVVLPCLFSLTSLINVSFIICGFQFLTVE